MLGAVGFVIVVTVGVIAEPIRTLWGKLFGRFPTWSKMILCALCFGVWGGSAWGVLLVGRKFLGPVAAAHDVLAFAFTVSLFGFLVQLADHVVGLIGRKT